MKMRQFVDFPIAAVMLGVCCGVSAQTPPTGWWQTQWLYRMPITVQNTSTSAGLPANYSVKLVVNTQSLISAGQMLADCSDMRVLYYNGTTNTQLDRIVNFCGSAQTEVWFSLQRAIGSGASDSSYYLYYGNASPGTPSANGMNVFLFYEDWENGASHWISAGGLDSANSGTMGTSQVSTDVSLSPTHSQKFTQQTTGGDAFSGLIPVSSNTQYVVSVWGESSTADSPYLPVGFVPYSTGRVAKPSSWLWTNQWGLSTNWTQESALFTTDATTVDLQLMSEWWSTGPGLGPVYVDNIVLRYGVASEPILSAGSQQGVLPLPTLSNITATNPVQLGNPASVSAVATAGSGTTISQVALQVLSPQVTNVNMTLGSGSNSSGTWQAQFTPNQAAVYSYQIVASASNGMIGVSPLQGFSAVSSQGPIISLVSITNPIHVNSTQQLEVQVTDPGLVNSVTITVNGITYPMTSSGNQYTYSWVIQSEGTIPYTVSASDTAGNSSSLAGTFEVQAAGEVGVCTWYGCKQGAESFSEDDSTNACEPALQTAGMLGTFYVWQYSNGLGSSITTTQPAWVAQYSALGHEIGSHTVDHPCNTPCCSPSCTQSILAECPVSPTNVTSYRANELEPNIASIEQATNKPVLSLAWPCGCADPYREQAASYYFVGARGFFDSVANETWVDNINPGEPFDWMNLWVALGVEPGQTDYDPAVIDNAVAEDGWVIVTTHGDCSEIPYMGQRSNVLWAAPIGTVLKYMKVRDAAIFSNYARTTTSISFNAVHNLPTFQRQKLNGTYFLPVIYDNVVTLMVHVLPTDNVTGVLLDGSPVTYATQAIGGATYVTFDAALLNSRSVQVLLGPDFSLAMAPSAQTVAPGSQASFTVTTSSIDSYSGSVNLSVSGLPTGSTYTLNPATVSVPGTSTLTVSTAAATTPGIYTVVVSGTDGTRTQTANSALTVSGTVRLVSLSLSPTAVVGGGTATGTVTLSGGAPSGGMAITLASSGSAATVPASVTVAAGATTGTFSVNTSVVSATTAVTITASDGSNPQTATLTVQAAAGSVPWWQSGWQYRLPLTVQNNATAAAVPVDYSVKVVINSSQLISAQQMQSGCADLRVGYFNGTSWTELNRVVNYCNAAQTEVWFALQRSIAASGSDSAYYVYYGNATAGAAPSNGEDVFVFYENWENGSGDWTSAGGLDATNSGTMGTSQISTNYAWSPTHSQEFTVQGAGGDAFSGYIPVTANTMYLVSVWGISATAADAPVGFDPYTTGYSKGAETWLWTSGWTLSSQWTQSTATFTTASSTAYIKLKDEWWNQGPGTAPVYLDDLVLRYAMATEPTVTAGSLQTN